MNRSLEELLRNLMEELTSTGEVSPDNPDELEDIVQVFCRHKRVLRILLTLCEE